MQNTFVIDAKKLQQFFAIPATLTDEILLKINVPGSPIFQLAAVDPANVAMCAVSMTGDHFDQVGELPQEAGLDLAILARMLAGFKSKYAQPIALAFDQPDQEAKENPKYHLSGWKYGLDIQPQIEHSHRIIDPIVIRTAPKILEVNFSVNIKIPAMLLHDVIKTVKQTGCDHLAIERTETHLVFNTDVAQNDGQKMRYSIDIDALQDSGDGQSARSMFSLDYLIKMMKAIPKDCLVGMRFGQDYPVRLEFQPFGKGFEAMFLLAPRIEEM